jgi:sugar-specific transcriptional regulator TrmB
VRRNLSIDVVQKCTTTERIKYEDWVCHGMDIRERLEEVGLSNNEVKVYLFLVDHGSSKAGKTAKGTGIQRSSAYAAINSLTHKGLVSYVTVGKTKFFQATSPERLIEFIKEKEELIKDIVPELRERYKLNRKEGQVRLFKGTAGVKSVFKDIIRSKHDNLCWGSDGDFGKRMPAFCKQYVRDQNLNDIKTKVLTRIRHHSYSKGTTYRYVDNARNSNVAVNIYGDKINIIIWTDEPEAIIIENKEAANVFRDYFDFMWKNSRK